MKSLINKAISTKAPKYITELCGEYYEPYYHLMYLLARKMKGFAVELGVHKGRGAASLALGGCQVLGIDHTFQPELEKVLKKFNNFTFLESDSLPVPMVLKHKKISILHIDTEHSYSMAKAEFEGYETYLIDGAIVLFDDLHAMDDDVLRYFNELDYKKYTDDRLHSCGYGVLIYDKLE